MVKVHARTIPQRGTPGSDAIKGGNQVLLNVSLVKQYWKSRKISVEFAAVKLAECEGFRLTVWQIVYVLPETQEVGVSQRGLRADSAPGLKLPAE